LKKSNLSDAIKISFYLLFCKSQLRSASLSFVRLSWGRITDKFAIDWQNFIILSSAQVTFLTFR